MKITRIITEWEDGKQYIINEPDVTHFLEAGGNEAIQMYILFAMARNLAGGLNWSEVKQQPEQGAD